MQQFNANLPETIELLNISNVDFHRKNVILANLLNPRAIRKQDNMIIVDINCGLAILTKISNSLHITHVDSQLHRVEFAVSIDDAQNILNVIENK